MTVGILELELFKDRVEPLRFVLTQKPANGGAETSVDLTPIQKLTLIVLASPNEQVDSVTHPAAFDWTTTNGTIVVDVGELAEITAIDEGAYYLRLIGEDGAGKKTQFLHEHSRRRRALLRIWDTTVGV